MPNAKPKGETLAHCHSWRLERGFSMYLRSVSVLRGSGRWPCCRPEPPWEAPGFPVRAAAPAGTSRPRPRPPTCAGYVAVGRETKVEALISGAY